MKVRLLNLVALAAIATGVQGVAQQQDDSLERALADLNSGLEVPATFDGGTVGAANSDRLSIYGDARARNTWLNPSGAGADQKNVDVRIRLGFDFTVNENAFATVEFIASENWGYNPLIASGVGNAATLEPSGPTLNTGSVWQAYFGATDWLLEDSTWTIGRRAWTFGSGRIMGSDDWDQLPATFGGLWFQHPLEGFNLEAFMITEVFNVRPAVAGNNARFTGSGNPVSAGDADLFGVSLDFELEDVPVLGEIAIRPYLLHYSPQGANLPTTTGRRTWYGAEVSGTWEFVNWDIEGVWVDAPNNNAALGNVNPSTSKFNAYAFDFDIDLSEFIGEDLPAGLSPVIQFGLAAADAANLTVNPVYHDAAGLYDLQNRVGAPGVWGGAADSVYVGLGFTPVEGWDVGLKFVDFDDNNAADDFGPGIRNADASEIDFTVGHTWENGVQANVGWARVDFNDLSANAYVVYGTLGLAF